MNDLTTPSKKVERYQRSLNKLELFRTFDKPGWDLGRGDPIEVSCIDAALSILEFSFRVGLWKSSVFPAPSGSVLVAFPYKESCDIEIYIDVDGTFDFSVESAGEITQEFPSLDMNQLLFAIDQLCKSEYLTNNFISTMSSKNFVAPPLSPLLTEDFLYSRETVELTYQAQYAVTSQSNIEKSQEIHQSTGILIPA